MTCRPCPSCSACWPGWSRSRRPPPGPHGSTASRWWSTSRSAPWPSRSSRSCAAARCSVVCCWACSPRSVRPRPRPRPPGPTSSRAASGWASRSPWRSRASPGTRCRRCGGPSGCRSGGGCCATSRCTGRCSAGVRTAGRGTRWWTSGGCVRGPPSGTRCAGSRRRGPRSGSGSPGRCTTRSRTG